MLLEQKQNNFLLFIDQVLFLERFIYFFNTSFKLDLLIMNSITLLNFNSKVIVSKNHKKGFFLIITLINFIFKTLSLYFSIYSSTCNEIIIPLVIFFLRFRAFMVNFMPSSNSKLFKCCFSSKNKPLYHRNKTKNESSFLFLRQNFF